MRTRHDPRVTRRDSGTAVRGQPHRWTQTPPRTPAPWTRRSLCGRSRTGIRSRAQGQPVLYDDIQGRMLRVRASPLSPSSRGRSGPAKESTSDGSFGGVGVCFKRDEQHHNLPPEGELDSGGERRGAEMETPGPSAALPRSRWARMTARLVQTGLGLLFLWSGLSKAWQPSLFEESIARYAIIHAPPVVLAAACALILVECTLGAALLLDFHPRQALAATGALLVLFVGVLAWGHVTGVTDTCGCFGAFSHTPGQALILDVALAVAVLGAWCVRREDDPIPGRLRTGFVWAFVLTGVALTLLGARRDALAPPPDLGPEPFLKMKVVDVPVSLTAGERLVVIMSTECDDCRKQVPLYNTMAADHRLPTLVALAPQPSKARAEFIRITGARFPLGQFAGPVPQALGMQAFPATFLLRDGHIAWAWRRSHPPRSEEVLQRLRQVREGQ